jgi:multiple sugar transport system permease protein
VTAPAARWESEDRGPGPQTDLVGTSRGRARRLGRSRRPRVGRARRALTVIGFLSPWLLGVGLFFLYPLASTIYFSFTHYDLLSNPRWVGLSNYRFMFTEDPDLIQAMKNTLWLVVVMVPLRVLLGLGVAGLAVSLKRGVSLFRAMVYLPYLVPPVAGTIAFVFLLNPGTGPVNHVLGWFGIDGPGWFTSTTWAKPSLVLLSLWAIGDLMVIMMAALLDVPTELHEAAAIDGASGAQRFRFVTLPAISPVLLFATITGIIETLQYFTQAEVAAKVASGVTDLPGTSQPPGYPQDATLTYPQWIVEQGFRQFNLGYASALSVLLFVVALLVTSVLLSRAGSLTGDAA